MNILDHLNDFVSPPQARNFEVSTTSGIFFALFEPNPRYIFHWIHSPPAAVLLTPIRLWRRLWRRPPHRPTPIRPLKSYRPTPYRPTLDFPDSYHPTIESDAIRPHPTATLHETLGLLHNGMQVSFVLWNHHRNALQRGVGVHNTP